MESAPALWLSSVHGEARQGIRVGEGGHLQLAVPLSLTAPVKAVFSSELTPQVPVASIPPPCNAGAQEMIPALLFVIDLSSPWSGISTGGRESLRHGHPRKAVPMGEVWV